MGTFIDKAGGRGFGVTGREAVLLWTKMGVGQRWCREGRARHGLKGLIGETHFVRATGHKTLGESSVILQIVVRVQLTSRRILRD